jgi:hypothetical protein
MLPRLSVSQHMIRRSPRRPERPPSRTRIRLPGAPPVRHRLRIWWRRGRRLQGRRQPWAPSKLDSERPVLVTFSVQSIGRHATCAPARLRCSACSFVDIVADIFLSLSVMKVCKKCTYMFISSGGEIGRGARRLAHGVDSANEGEEPQPALQTLGRSPRSWRITRRWRASLARICHPTSSSPQFGT